MRYINNLREEVEMLLHHLSSSSFSSIGDKMILSRFSKLVWDLHKKKDYETIQKLYTAYKKFYEEEIIPQYKDQLKHKDFCYNCSDYHAFILIKSTILYSFIEERLPLKEEEIASLILTFFLRGEGNYGIEDFSELIKEFDLSNLDSTKILTSFNKKGLVSFVKKFTLDNMNLLSLILFFARNIEILERIKDYFNLFTLSKKLKSEDVKYILEKLDLIFSITTSLKNSIKDRLENALKILERRLLEIPWLDKDLAKTLFENTKIVEVTKYKVKIFGNLSDIEEKIEADFITEKINIESFFENIRKLYSFKIVDRGIGQIMDNTVNGISMTVFDSVRYPFLRESEIIKALPKGAIQQYSKFFSFEDEIKTKLEKIIEKVLLKFEEKIEKIIHIYETNPPDLSEKFLRIIYDEYISIIKILNREVMVKFDSIKEKDLPPVAFSLVEKFTTEKSKKSIRNLKYLVSKLDSIWGNPDLKFFFRNLFVFYQIRKILTKKSPENVKYFDKALYRYFKSSPRITFLITGRTDEKFNIKLEDILYFVCSCVFLLTIASEILLYSYEVELLLGNGFVWVDDEKNLFGLTSLYIKKYLNHENISLKEIQLELDKSFHIIYFCDLYSLGKTLVKAFKKQKNNLELKNPQPKLEHIGKILQLSLFNPCPSLPPEKVSSPVNCLQPS
ncbi:MAG: hypothetical protein ACP5HC_01980 [Caldisericum sp.]